MGQFLDTGTPLVTHHTLVLVIRATIPFTEENIEVTIRGLTISRPGERANLIVVIRQKKH